MSRRFLAGRYRLQHGRHLLVSVGLGNSGLPIRLGPVPEIVVCDLIGDSSSCLERMPNLPLTNLLLGLALGTVLGALLALVYFLRWRNQYVKHARQDAVLRSQAVIAGKVQEQLVPLLPGFQFNPKDARFLGSPVDLIVFDGLDEGTLRRIVFLEVKTGGSALSGRERQLRNAVLEGRVEWEELRLRGQGS